MVTIHGGLFDNLLSRVGEKKKTNLEGERHCFARGRIKRDRTIDCTPTEEKKSSRSGLDTPLTMGDGDTNAALQTAQGSIYIHILRDAC